MVNELSTYMTRLRIRLNRVDIPESYFREAGHPYLATPNGRVLRPSLSHSLHSTGI